MNEVVTLARRINEREQVIQQCRTKTLDEANAAIAEAILQGKDLIELKRRTPHGQWLLMLSEHCPKVGERQAQRYVKLASNPSVATKADSMRGALALLDDTRRGKKKQPRSWPPYLEAIGRLSKLVGYVTKFPVTHWPDDGVTQFRNELLPVAKLLWPDKFEDQRP